MRAHRPQSEPLTACHRLTFFSVAKISAVCVKRSREKNKKKIPEPNFLPPERLPWRRKKKSRRPSRASLRLGAAGNRTFWLAPGAKRTCSADKLGISVCVIKEPEPCRLPGTPRARLRCSWCPRSKECMRPQPEHDRFVSTSRSTKQGHADCRAARAHKLPCHTVLRAFRSPAQRLRLRLRIWMKWMVIGMEWLIGCLAGSFARQRYANSKNLHRRSADCLAWNDAPHPSGTTLQGRTAQCMCIVK